MREYKNNEIAVCYVCGHHKVVGRFEIHNNIFRICPACLDNFSRLIAKKADKIKWNRATMKWENLYKEDIQEFERLYPNVDVLHHIEHTMPEWINKQILAGKAVKSNWRSFILRWLAKRQREAVGL